MRASEPGYVILRVRIKQTISALKQLAENFQFFGVFQTSHIATNREPGIDQNIWEVKNFWGKIFRVGNIS